MNLVTPGTQERILEAAVQLFASNGYGNTSTREVARFAHVTEASIFHYFHSKRDLFVAALQSRLDRLHIRKELQNALDSDLPPDLVVPLIIELLVHTATYQRDLIMLLSVGFMELRTGTEPLYRKHLLPILRAISEYLERSENGGKMRKLSPTITTAAFAATILLYPSLYESLTGLGVPFSNADEAVGTYSRYWLKMLTPLPERKEVVQPHAQGIKAIISNIADFS